LRLYHLGGFFGPTLVGWDKNMTGNFVGGLYALAVCALVSAIVSLCWLRVPRTIPAGASATAAAE
jgi:MFS transporter, ACS family, tartrate transporter